MNTLITRLLFLSLLFPGTVLAGVWEIISGRSAYPVIESGYWLDGTNSVYWIDEQQILFAGGDLKGYADHGAQVQAGKNPKLGLYVWNVATGAVQAHAKIVPNSTLCYRGGRIEYTVDAKDGYLVRRKGRFGEEREVQEAAYKVAPWVSARAKGEIGDRLNCRLYSQYDLMPKGIDIPLIEGHGFLGWQGGGETPWPAGSEAPVRYYKDATTPPIMLPLKRKDIRTPDAPSPAIYAEWANVYVLQGEAEWGRPPTWANFLPKDQPYPVYLIKPGSGEVTTLHAWYQKGVGNWQYFYTKAGLLVFSSAVRGYGLDDAGIYRVVDRGYEKIIKGIPKTGALSPDGCRFAVGIQYIKQKGVRGPIQLKVIDLCKGAK
ncbi:MAG: hypothetical protein H3C26_01905 [Rhodocyclaceae bacterium]|nr:hypothetical protein [Rhodocyclaceae bacterium]